MIKIIFVEQGSMLKIEISHFNIIYNLSTVKLNWFKTLIFEFRTPKIVSAEIFMTVGCVFIVFPTLKLLYSLAVVTF